MDDQISMAGFESADHAEKQYIQSILPELEAAVEECGGCADMLTIRGQVSGYTSVSFGSLTAFRLCLRGKQHYVALPLLYAESVPKEWQLRKAAGSKSIRVIVDEAHPVDGYRPLLILSVKDAVDRYPKEWDCCSRYMECSDAKTCIHPDKRFALGCGYRKILNTGKIFYGKNRNV